MKYNHFDARFPSADGKNTVFADIYTPKTETAVGVIQISHGMVDYIGRYKELVAYFTERGYVVAGNHHLGHGKTAACDEDLGFFASEGGAELLVEDLHTMNRHLRSEFPTLPVFLLGHSMGSFVARLYAIKYPSSIAGIIIHGTAGPNPILPVGKAVVGLKMLMHGERYRSKTVKKLAFLGYNSHFDKSEGPHAWLTRDIYLVSDRDENKFTSFTFTLSAYRDLFGMLGACNSRAWFAAYPKSLPTLIVSGGADPVGNYGKGPQYVYKHLVMQRCTAVSARTYDGARHELFNETNRKEIFADILEWMKGAV